MEWLAILVAAVAALWLSKSFGLYGVLAAFAALIAFRLWMNVRRRSRPRQRKA